MYSDLTRVLCQEISDNSDDKFYNKRICDVCKVENDKYKYECFSTSNLNDEMISNFIICGKYNGVLNKVFEYCWDQEIELSAITTIKDVSYDSVHEKVWKPTIARSQLLLSQLKNKTVMLKEIEYLYQIDNFPSQISALCNAMHQCYPKSNEAVFPPHEWVPQTVGHIALYHEVANNPKCTEATNVILKVQASMKLQGDFKIIEDLANHVRI